MSGTIEWVQEELDRFHGERLAEWGKGRCWFFKKKVVGQITAELWKRREMGELKISANDKSKAEWRRGKEKGNWKDKAGSGGGALAEPKREYEKREVEKIA